MRLTTDQLYAITKLKRKTAQAKWFKNFFGVDVPIDHIGVIMTDWCYEKLLEKRLGLSTSLASKESQEKRPALRP